MATNTQFSPDTFLLVPENKPFLEGQHSKPNSQYVYAHALAILVSAPILLYFVSQETARPTLFAAVLGLGYLLWAWSIARVWMLDNSGTLLAGEVVNIKLHECADRHDLEVQYKFTSPQSDEVVVGTEKRLRDDLEDVEMPDEGSPVAILFLNDRNHRIL